MSELYLEISEKFGRVSVWNFQHVPPGIQLPLSGTGAMVTTAARIRQVLPLEWEVKESDCSRLREATL